MHDNDKVAHHGCYTLVNRLTETCSIGLQRTSLILDIYVMVTLTPIKTRYLLTSITPPYCRLSFRTQIHVCFFKLTAVQVLVFLLDHGLKPGKLSLIGARLAELTLTQDLKLTKV